jgi:hypothetical protein
VTATKHRQHRATMTAVRYPLGSSGETTRQGRVFLVPSRRLHDQPSRVGTQLHFVRSASSSSIFGILMPREFPIRTMRALVTTVITV